MNKAYTRINWKNEPSSNTPINETNLNKMDSALDEVDNRVVEQDKTKAEKKEVETLLEDVYYDASTTELKFTKKNGTNHNVKLDPIASLLGLDVDSDGYIVQNIKE